MKNSPEYLKHSELHQSSNTDHFLKYRSLLDMKPYIIGTSNTRSLQWLEKYVIALIVKIHLCGHTKAQLFNS